MTDRNLGFELGRAITQAFAIRDQAHIFHLQTRSFARHKNLDNFYHQFLDDVDDLIEMIMGKYDIKPDGFDKHSTEDLISFTDFEENMLHVFYINAEKVFNNDFYNLIDPEKDAEIVDQINLIKSRIDTLKYLMTLT
jgi:hypothetical protein